MDNFGLLHIIASEPFTPNCADKLPKGWERLQNFSVVNHLSKCDVFFKGTAKKNFLLFPLLIQCKIGDKKDAFIYFPTKKEYVNIMPYRLHLWSEYESDNVL